MNEWLLIESEVQVSTNGDLSFQIGEIKTRVRQALFIFGRTDNIDSTVSNAVLYVIDSQIQAVTDASVLNHAITCWPLSDLKPVVNLGKNYADKTVVIAIRSGLIPDRAKSDRVRKGVAPSVDIKLAASESIGSDIGAMPLSAVLLSELSNPTGSTAACLQRLGISVLKRMVDLDLAFNTIDEAVVLCSSLVSDEHTQKLGEIARRAELQSMEDKVALFQAKAELAEYQRKFYLSQIQYYQNLQQSISHR